MSFKDFIQSARVTATPRGEFIADMKTLVNAGVFPNALFGWNDLYSFMAYHHRTSPEAIEIARKVWREYKAKVTALEGAREVA